MEKYILDTNTWIEYFHQRSGVKERVDASLDTDIAPRTAFGVVGDFLVCMSLCSLYIIYMYLRFVNYIGGLGL